MTDHKKNLTFKKYYENKRQEYTSNRIEGREDEFKVTKYHEMLKKILTMPFLFFKATDNLNNSVIDTASEKFVAMAIASLYISIIMFAFNAASYIISTFKEYIEYIYNLENVKSVILLIFLTIFVVWVLIDQIIRKFFNKLYKEKSLKKMLEQKFNNEYDKKIANDEMIEIFVYYYQAEIYKEALQKINEKKGKINHIDLLNINDYI